MVTSAAVSSCTGCSSTPRSRPRSTTPTCRSPSRARSACGWGSSRSPTGCSGGSGAATSSSSTSRRRWPPSRWSATSALMAIGRPLAGRLQYEFAVLNGADGQLNDNIDLAYAARVAAAPWGPLPAGEGDIEWHPDPRAMMGLAGYYNLIPTDVIARTGDPTGRHRPGQRRPHRQRGGLAGERGAEGALARRRAAGRVVRTHGDARRHVPVAQLPGRLRAGELLHHSRPACRSPAASARRTCRDTSRRPPNARGWGREVERAVRRASTPTCAAATG